MPTPDTDKTRDLFIAGLRNAHAMENQALSIIKPQLERIETYPAVASRLRSHLDETNGQIERLETALDHFGAERSALKDMALSVGGSLAAIGHSMSGDEILKNSFANFAFENYEIAAYKSLIAIGETAGFSEVTPLLKQNLAEEEAMAHWLDENLRTVTLQYASLEEAGRNAKI